MKLSRLLSRWCDTKSLPPDRDINDLVIDSRQVAPGDLFCALAPDTSILRQHIEQAFARGASCVLVDKQRTGAKSASNLVVGLPDLAHALGHLAVTRYGNPTLNLYAVTGTNGKTSVAWMGAQLLKRLGHPCGYIGTLGARLHDICWHTDLTTPDIFTVYRLLALMQQAGAQSCFLEASSHALAQNRLAGLNFTLGVFTNLSQDHLDYHGDMQAYKAAKWQLWPRCKTIISNKNDPHSKDLPTHIPCLSYGSHTTNTPDLLLTSYKATTSQLNWTTKHQGTEISSSAPIIGRFMLDNLLAVYASALALGYADSAISAAMQKIHAPPGRMELAHNRPTVIIDFAHTPDALEKLLQSLDEVRTPNQRLAVVFGCGGNRDKAKRPQMGAIAARYAAKVFITNDNPRHEPPQAIADAIIAGINKADTHKLVCQLERRAAITQALAWCRPEDCLAIAGKGHETTQQLGAITQPFNDAEVVMEYFAHVG